MAKEKQLATDSLAFSREQVDLIKQTVAKGATDSELQLFLYTAKRIGLDPLLRQVHAVKRWDSASGKETMAIQTGIDGYRLIAGRTGMHMGTSDAVFDREDQEHPGKATVIVYRLINGKICEFPGTARWSEYCAMRKDGTPMALWKKMPYLMLGKCAEALALRKAFPQELSGLYTFEEMDQADNEQPIKIAKPVISGSGEGEAGSRQKTQAPLAPEKPAKAAAGKLAKLAGKPSSAKLLEFLDLGGYTEADFLSVARANQWVPEDIKSIRELSTERLTEFLRSDNRDVIMEQLDSMEKADRVGVI